jgi:hypothetical protein
MSERDIEAIPAKRQDREPRPTVAPKAATVKEHLKVLHDEASYAKRGAAAVQTDNVPSDNDCCPLSD